MTAFKVLRALGAGVLAALAISGQPVADATTPEPEWLRMAPSLVAAEVTNAGGAGEGNTSSGNGSIENGNGLGGVDVGGETPSTRITGTITIVQLGPDENALGASSAPVSSATIDQDGTCSWVDNAGTPATAFMPLRTLLERTSFMTNKPAMISLPNCCRRARANICGASVDLDYGRDGEIVQLAGGYSGEGYVMCEAASFAWKPAGSAGYCSWNPGGPGVTDSEGRQCDTGCGMDFSSVSVEGREDG